MIEQEEALRCSSAWTKERISYRSYVRHELIGDVYVIVEIGVHYGFSLFAMAMDFPEAAVFGIDNFSIEDGGDEPRKHLEKHLPNFDNVRLIEADSQQAALDWKSSIAFLDIDILHIDGDHSYAQVARDFESWVPHVRPGGVVLFHDVQSYPNGPGKFHYELEGVKKVEGNLGVWYKLDA